MEPLLMSHSSYVLNTNKRIQQLLFFEETLIFIFLVISFISIKVAWSSLLQKRRQMKWWILQIRHTKFFVSGSLPFVHVFSKSVNNILLWDAACVLHVGSGWITITGGHLANQLASAKLNWIFKSRNINILVQSLRYWSIPFGTKSFL